MPSVVEIYQGVINFPISYRVAFFWYSKGMIAQLDVA